MEYDFDLVSIGSGSAGRKIAVALKRDGWNTAIIEKDVEDHFGGTCINSGCIPTKALIEKSLITSDIKIIHNHKHRIVDRVRSGTLKHVDERVEVEVIRGHGSFIDNHTVEVAGKHFTSEIFVIATGSKASIPPIEGLRNTNFMTSYEILDIEDVPESLLIIGGGRIGLEFGSFYNRLGSTVSIFEGMNQLLPGEDFEMAESIRQYLQDQGINIYKDRFVDEVREHHQNGSLEFEVILNDGANAGSYRGELLLVATGRTPNTDGLALENAGVMTENHSIKVDEYLQSNVPNIFAVGDVIGDPMFTNWASYQSGVLLKNLKKSREKNEDWEKLSVPNIPRICFLEPELASTGLTEEQAKNKYGERVVTYNFKNKWLGKSMIVDDWDGYLKGIGLKGSNEILGVSLWGKRAGSLLQIVIFAMENGLGWRELCKMVYGHPILAEGVYSLASGMKNRTKTE